MFALSSYQLFSSEAFEIRFIYGKEAHKIWRWSHLLRSPGHYAIMYDFDVLITLHFQAVKLLAAESGKKGRINLVFLAGDRVLRYLATCYEREKVFTQLLK